MVGNTYAFFFFLKIKFFSEGQGKPWRLASPRCGVGAIGRFRAFEMVLPCLLGERRVRAGLSAARKRKFLELSSSTPGTA